jgi:dynein heavy chain
MEKLSFHDLSKSRRLSALGTNNHRRQHVGGIKARVDDLSKAVNQLGKCLEFITSFQIAFNSLSKVFQSSHIQHELPTPAKDLVMVHHAFKLEGKEARDSLKVFKSCANQKTVTQFQLWIDTTDQIQKALEAFL